MLVIDSSAGVSDEKRLQEIAARLYLSGDLGLKVDDESGLAFLKSLMHTYVWSPANIQWQKQEGVYRLTPDLYMIACASGETYIFALSDNFLPYHSVGVAYQLKTLKPAVYKFFRRLFDDQLDKERALYARQNIWTDKVGFAICCSDYKFQRGSVTDRHIQEFELALAASEHLMMMPLLPGKTLAKFFLDNENDIGQLVDAYFASMYAVADFYRIHCVVNDDLHSSNVLIAPTQGGLKAQTIDYAQVFPIASTDAYWRHRYRQPIQGNSEPTQSFKRCTRVWNWLPGLKTGSLAHSRYCLMRALLSHIDAITHELVCHAALLQDVYHHGELTAFATAALRFYMTSCSLGADYDSMPTMRCYIHQHLSSDDMVNKTLERYDNLLLIYITAFKENWDPASYRGPHLRRPHLPDILNLLFLMLGTIALVVHTHRYQALKQTQHRPDEAALLMKHQALVFQYEGLSSRYESVYDDVSETDHDLIDDNISRHVSPVVVPMG